MIIIGDIRGLCFCSFLSEQAYIRKPESKIKTYMYLFSYLSHVASPHDQIRSWIIVFISTASKASCLPISTGYKSEINQENLTPQKSNLLHVWNRFILYSVTFWIKIMLWAILYCCIIWKLKAWGLIKTTYWII